MEDSEKNHGKLKKPEILYDSTYITFWRKQQYTVRKISSCQELEVGEEDQL